jgi:hypothetical protein
LFNEENEPLALALGAPVDECLVRLVLLYEEGSDSASRSFNDFRFDDDDDDPLPFVEFGGVNN